jgi:hypothetical protein
MLRRVRSKLARTRTAKPDLADEIEAAPSQEGALTLPELGELPHARHGDIRDALRKHPQRFKSSQNTIGRSPKAKSWTCAAEAPPTRPSTSAEFLEGRDG